MNSFFRSLWVQMGLLLLISALLALGWRFIGPEPVIPQPPAQLEPAEPAGLNPVGVDRVMELHQAGALFLDLRPADQFKAAHIPGAEPFNLSLAHGQKMIVLYGGPDQFNQALVEGQKLVDRGVERVYVFLEGWEGWLAAGLKTEEGGR